MSYFKFSVIGGRKADGAYINASRPGYWKPETAACIARRMGIVGSFALSHHTGDLSGRGRGGKDREMVVYLD